MRKWEFFHGFRSLGRDTDAAEETLTDFERHALWVAHGRWAMDHLQHRVEMTGQLAMGMIAVQGVLIALVAGSMDSSDEALRVALGSAGLIVLAVAAGSVLFGAFPRNVSSINDEEYRAGWTRETTESPWYSPDQQFAEELLQTNDKEKSPIASTVGLISQRMRWIKRGMVMTLVALVLIVLASAIPSIQGVL